MIGKVSIEKMIMRLAKMELDLLDDGDLIDLFLDGCKGYNNMNSREITELYKYYKLDQDY